MRLTTNRPSTYSLLVIETPTQPSGAKIMSKLGYSPFLRVNSTKGISMFINFLRATRVRGLPEGAGLEFAFNTSS